MELGFGEIRAGLVCTLPPNAGSVLAGQMPKANPREELDVVTENDDPISTATRREVHEEVLLHRAVHVLLVGPDGDLLLQRRSLDKRTYPGLLTSSASGHVPAGEEPRKAARRETEEELGVTPPALDRVERLQIEDLDVGEREIVHVFLGRFDQRPKLTPDEDEVAETRWASLATVETWIEEDPGRLAGSFVPVLEAVRDDLARASGGR